MEEDIVRVIRILEYEGPRSWVENTLSKRAVRGDFRFGGTSNPRVIREAILGEFPSFLRREEVSPSE